MSDREQSCEARLPAHLKGRLEDFEHMANGRTPDGEPDEDGESVYDYGLSLSVNVVVRWDLSTGGPGDWLEFVCDGDAWRRNSVEVLRTSYHFNDWFDHAERTLDADEESTVLAVAESVLESLAYSE